MIRILRRGIAQRIGCCFFLTCNKKIANSTVYEGRGEGRGRRGMTTMVIELLSLSADHHCMFCMGQDLMKQSLALNFNKSADGCDQTCSCKQQKVPKIKNDYKRCPHKVDASNSTLTRDMKTCLLHNSPGKPTVHSGISPTALIFSQFPVKLFSKDREGKTDCRKHMLLPVAPILRTVSITVDLLSFFKGP